MGTRKNRLAIDCGYTIEPPRRGGSNEYPQYMFWSKNKKNRYTPAYHNFAISKWGLRGYTFHGHVFLMPLFCCRKYFVNSSSLGLKCVTIVTFYIIFGFQAAYIL